MSYCGEQDVKNEFKNIVWDTTNGIASSTITEWCNQESSVIDSYLSAIYVTPVTGAVSVLTLKKIAIMMVSSRVKKTLQVKEVNQANQDQVIDEYATALEMLSNISKGLLILTDATLISNSNQSLKVFYSAVEPVINKDADQW